MKRYHLITLLTYQHSKHH